MDHLGTFLEPGSPSFKGASTGAFAIAPQHEAEVTYATANLWQRINVDQFATQYSESTLDISPDSLFGRMAIIAAREGNILYFTRFLLQRPPDEISDDLLPTCLQVAFGRDTEGNTYEQTGVIHTLLDAAHGRFHPNFFVDMLTAAVEFSCPDTVGLMLRQIKKLSSTDLTEYVQVNLKQALQNTAEKGCVRIAKKLTGVVVYNQSHLNQAIEMSRIKEAATADAQQREHRAMTSHLLSVAKRFNEIPAADLGMLLKAEIEIGNLDTACTIIRSDSAVNISVEAVAESLYALLTTEFTGQRQLGTLQEARETIVEILAWHKSLQHKSQGPIQKKLHLLILLAVRRASPSIISSLLNGHSCCEVSIDFAAQLFIEAVKNYKAPNFKLIWNHHKLQKVRNEALTQAIAYTRCIPEETTVYPQLDLTLKTDDETPGWYSDQTWLDEFEVSDKISTPQQHAFEEEPSGLKPHPREDLHAFFIQQQTPTAVTPELKGRAVVYASSHGNRGIVEFWKDIGLDDLSLQDLEKAFSMAAANAEEEIFALLLPFLERLQPEQINTILRAGLDAGQTWVAGVLATQHLKTSNGSVVRCLDLVDSTVLEMAFSLPVKFAGIINGDKEASIFKQLLPFTGRLESRQLANILSWALDTVQAWPVKLLNGISVQTPQGRDARCWEKIDLTERVSLNQYLQKKTNSTC